jgi:hypothetical protein
MEDWQRRRNRINHDEIKNGLLPRCGRLVRVVTGAVEGSNLTVGDLQAAVERWQGIRSEIANLVRDCPNEMSPRVLLSRRPLDRLDVVSREWLGGCVHGLWLRRKGLTGLLDSVRSKVAEADTAASALLAQISDRGASAAISVLAAQADAIANFCSSVRAVSEALHLLPNSIEVV